MHTNLPLSRDDELVSSNVTEKETKIIFLQKLVTFLERCLETQINVKPAKIVAGLDPERTRHFLQLFTVVATMRIEGPTLIATQAGPDSDQEKHEESPAKPNIVSKAEVIEVHRRVADEAPFAPFSENINARPTTARGARPNLIKQRSDVVRPIDGILKEVGCELEGMAGAMLDIVADDESLVKPAKGCTDCVDQAVIGDEPLVKRMKGCDDGVDKKRTTNNMADNESLVKRVGVDQTQKTITKLISKPLPAQLSDIDFASLAKAIRDISHSTTSMAKHLSSIPDNVEKLMKERSRWIAEEVRLAA